MCKYCDNEHGDWQTCPRISAIEYFTGIPGVVKRVEFFGKVDRVNEAMRLCKLLSAQANEILEGRSSPSVGFEDKES